MLTFFFYVPDEVVRRRDHGGAGGLNVGRVVLLCVAHRVGGLQGVFIVKMKKHFLVKHILMLSSFLRQFLTSIFVLSLFSLVSYREPRSFVCIPPFRIKTAQGKSVNVIYLFVREACCMFNPLPMP